MRFLGVFMVFCNNTTFGRTVSVYNYSTADCLCFCNETFALFISDGSLAEIFYGLARTHVSTNKLNRVDKLMAFLCVVIFPYLAAKLDSFRQKSKDEIENASPVEQKSGEMRRKKLAVQFITFARALGDSLQLVQFIAYMADVSRSHSLTNRIVRQQLNYLPPDTTVTWSWTDLFKGKFRGTALLSGVIFRSLELSAFFLQFLQWWQNETSFSTFLNLPTPEPPADALCSTKYRGICPICLQRWQIPTVNRISGYISFFV